MGRGRIHGPYTAAYGPCTRPVCTTRAHDCVRAVCTGAFVRVRGAYTAPYTGCVHGHVRDGPVHDTYTAAYTCLRVYVYKGRVHGRVRAIYTAENGMRSVYAAVYMARVDEHVHGCVWDVYMNEYMARYGRVHAPRP